MTATPLTPFAKRLRREATHAEQRLWSKLRSEQLEGVKFRRQEPFGRFILDFVCYEAKLVIELDGSQHLEQEGKDAVRDALMVDEGFTVMRFWDNEVPGDLDGVLEKIRTHCITLPPTPSHQGRGKR
jgi:very-short-patch-repair endonuclease